MSRHIAALGSGADAPFPPVEHALTEPDGLLAHGGDLSSGRLLNAYRNGIFPWSSEGEPILWWSPSQRAVFRTDGVHLSSRFKRSLSSSRLSVRADTCFEQVIDACAAAPRAGQTGTWITPGMVDGYTQLHRLGHAHSIEVFDGPDLVGGLYGVAVGRLFCGESMFSAQSGASSIALAALARRLHGWGWPLIDAQVPNDHTRRLGVETWQRALYLQALHELRDAQDPVVPWVASFGELSAVELGYPAPA